MVTAGRKRALWILLCLITGGPCAFLTLEGLFPAVAVCLFAVVVLSRRVGLLAESLGLFGASFTLVAAHFALPDLSIYSNFPTLAYFVAILAAGALMVIAGLLLKKPSQWFRY